MTLPIPRSRRLCAGALTALLVSSMAGCIGPLRQVRVDRDPSVPLLPGATWAYRPHEEQVGPEAEALLDNPIAHQRLERLLAAELAARGYRQVDDPEQASLLVDYHLGIKERQETVANTHATGAYAPITTCQDKILERPREATPSGDRARVSQPVLREAEHPAPRDTAKAGGRGNDRGDRRDSTAQGNSRGDDRKGNNAQGNRGNNDRDNRGNNRGNNDRDRGDNAARERVCTTKLVWGPYGPPETSFRTFTYHEGTIVVDLTDRVSGLVAWRVVGTRQLTLRDENEDVLHEVAQRLMRDLPAVDAAPR